MRLIETKRCSTVFWCSFLFLGFTIFLNSAAGTTLHALSLNDLTLGADFVVIGQATKKQSLRDETGRIVTDVTYRIDRYVVGEGPDEIIIRVQGGRLGNIGRHVWGAVKLDIAAPTLLFLEGQSSVSAPLIRVRGMLQGCFNIAGDQVSGSLYASRTLNNINLVGEQALDSLTHSNTSVFIPLDDFVSQIRELVDIAVPKQKQ